MNVVFSTNAQTQNAHRKGHVMGKADTFGTKEHEKTAILFGWMVELCSLDNLKPAYVFLDQYPVSDTFYNESCI